MGAAARFYLILYNGLEAALWTALTSWTIYKLTGVGQSPAKGTESVMEALPLLQITQTSALLEILHASLDLVRASPATTALQIGGKNLVVWTVMSQFPWLIEELLIGKWGYIGCLLAWGMSEMIRYGFFVAQLTAGEASSWLSWLRYNAFIVLYPIGLLSEAALVWLALTNVTDLSLSYKAYLSIGLLLYLPAGPYLYSHMLKQRRKTQAKSQKKQA